MSDVEAKKYLLIGPLPPEEEQWVTGVQVAFSIFVNALRDDKDVSFKVINSARGIRTQSIGRINSLRMWEVLKIVIEGVYNIFKSQTVYILLGSSWLGFLRDSLLLWVAALSNKRLVTHLNGGGYKDFYNSLSPMKQYIIRSTLNRVDKFIVLGETLKEQFYFIDDHTKIVVVPNGVPHILEENSLPSKKNQNDKFQRIELLYLSNLIVSKGYWDLLEACRILYHEMNIPFRCHFAGSFAQINTESDRRLFDTVDEAKASFFSFISEHNLEEVVIYHGVVKGENKNELLKNTHLFVLPTYYEWEGQPLSIIEAMSCGTPVITTNHKAIPDVVQDNVNGVFVEKCSPEEIATQIAWFYENPSKYSLYSQAAFSAYWERFSKEAYVNRLKEVVFSSD